MSRNKLGGDEARPAYFLLFLLGVLVGSLVRVGAFVIPARGVRWLEATLLPGKQ